ncbi:Gustatory receptor 104, partial [Frankliniella occidentalis]
SRASRWCLLFSLRLCEWSALVPPPPVRRLPALRYVLFLTWWCTSVSVTLGNQYLLLKNAREYIKGFSTISTVSFISSTIMTAIQPVVVLINSAVNFRRLSPHVAGLFMPPLRFNGWFVVACSTMAVGLVAKHALIWHAQRKGNLANFLEFLASFITLSFDSLVFLLCNCAQDKLYEVNTRLGDVDKVVPELRPLVLESAARQYELTADQ